MRETAASIKYKDRTEALWQIRHCFYQLISQERFDLLYRYADTYAELDVFRTSDISETDDTDWIPPYVEWFCDNDIAENTDNAAEKNADSEAKADSEQDEEKISADYRSFNPLPISVAAYDLREASSREDTEETSEEADHDEEESDDDQSDENEEYDDKKCRIKPKTEYKAGYPKKDSAEQCLNCIIATSGNRIIKMCR